MHHADPCAGRRRMFGPHVKIGFGGWREECEASPSCCDNSNILDGIVVGRDLRRIADPEARPHRGRNHWHRVGVGKSREETFSIHSLRCYRGRPVVGFLLTKAVEYAGNVALPAYEVERFNVLSVVES